MSDKVYLMRPDLGNEEYNAVKRVLDSLYLTEGPVTQEFEKSVASYVGAKHGIAITSCTTALHAVLEVVGLREKYHLGLIPFQYQNPLHEELW